MTHQTLFAGLIAAAAAALPAGAAEDPIAARQALMGSNGAAAAVAGALLKDEIAYDAKVAKSVLASLAATSIVLGDFFPEGTLDPESSEASPKIWEDAAGWEAELAKFTEAATAANAAAGRAGPADKAAFAAAIAPVFDSCQSCHEGFQTRN